MEAYGHDDPLVAETLQTLAYILMSQGRSTEAERPCLEAARDSQEDL